MRSNQPDYTDYSTDMIQAIERQRDEYRDERDFWKANAERFFNQRNRLREALESALPIVESDEYEHADESELVNEIRAAIENARVTDD